MKQRGLYHHWRQIYKQQKDDFRNYALIRLIRPYIDKNKEVIDIGCGSCGITLEMLCWGLDVTSIDSSYEMLSYGRKILSNEGYSDEKVVHTSLEQMAKLKPEKFQQAVCLDVIEHIEDDNKALKFIHSLLLPKGTLVLMVPALSWLYGPKDKDVGHYRRYDLHELKEKILEAGFIIKKIRYWNLIGLPITIISNILLKKRVPEVFRYNRKVTSRIVNYLLKKWFLHVENFIPLPIGLTLMVYAEKK